jgi:hypothetical protein
MDKKEVRKEIRRILKRDKFVRIRLDNMDCAFIDGYALSKYDSSNVWLMWKGDKIILVKYNHIISIA